MALDVINAYKYQLESTCCNGFQLQLLCMYIIGTFGSECFSLQEKLVKFLPQVGGILWDTWMNLPGFSQEMVGILCVCVILSTPQFRSFFGGNMKGRHLQ